MNKADQPAQTLAGRGTLPLADNNGLKGHKIGLTGGLSSRLVIYRVRMKFSQGIDFLVNAEYYYRYKTIFMNTEDKKQCFKRLASSRTNDIINKLRILGNCANRSAYDYSEEDIGKIFAAIEHATKEARSKFYFPKHKEGFQL